MFRVVLGIGTVFSLCLLEVPDAAAQRKGFIIGYGIGPGITSYSVSEDESLSDLGSSESKLGLVMDGKIGFTVGDAWRIYYTGKTAWLRDSSDRQIGHWLFLFCTAHTFAPRAPAFYLKGGLGASAWVPTVKDEFLFGFGMTFGAGYEFADRWMLDVDIMYGRPKDDTGTISALTAKLTFGILSH